MRKFIGWFVGWLDDVLVVGGCGLVLVFVWQVWPVGVWLVGGVMLISAGVLFGSMNAK